MPRLCLGGKTQILTFACSPRAREASAEKFNDELLELQENLNNELTTRLLNLKVVQNGHDTQVKMTF